MASPKKLELIKIKFLLKHFSRGTEGSWQNVSSKIHKNVTKFGCFPFIIVNREGLGTLPRAYCLLAEGTVTRARHTTTRSNTFLRSLEGSCFI